jgi:HEAT repeat protein
MDIHLHLKISTMKRREARMPRGGKGAGRQVSPSPKTINKLLKQLSSSSSKRRLQAIIDLSKIGEANPELIVGTGTTLVRSLQDLDAGVRRYAAYTLGLLGKQNPDYVSGAIQSLTTCLEDFDPGVRQHAAYAIGYIGRIPRGNGYGCVTGCIPAPDFCGNRDKLN